MITVTGSRIVVPEDAPRTVWMLERGEGVTASRAWAIARGGIKTWRRELEQMMNGSTFRVTNATRDGSAREAALLDEAALQRLGVITRFELDSHKLQLLIGPIAVQLDEKIQLLAARQSLDLQPRELQIAPFIVR